MKRLRITIICISVFAVSCAGIKPLEYRGHSDFSIDNISGNPTVKTDLRLYNPNRIGVKLKTTELIVFVNKKELGDAMLTSPVKIKGRSDFSLPFAFTTSYPKLAAVAVSDLGGFLKGDAVPYHIEGQFSIQKFFITRKISFTYRDTLQKTDLKY